MMDIETIDGFDNIFLIKNVYNLSLLNEFLQEDFDSYPQEKNLNVNGRYRCYGFPPSSKWQDLLHSVDYSNVIKLGYIHDQSSTFWIDDPQFTMGYHIDNGNFVAAMQVYLTSNENGGTTFINNNKIKFTIPYTKNCGYISFANKHKLQHGVVNPMNEKRYSIYTCFKEWVEIQ